MSTNQAGPGTSAASDVSRTYKIKLHRPVDSHHHVMRFMSQGGVDLTKMISPRLERQLPTAAVVEEKTMPEFGAGSEYGRAQREEARRRRRGFFKRPQKLDDFPWVLREGTKKKGSTKYLGRREAGAQQSVSYYLFRPSEEDGVFEATPVSAFYNFTPAVKYSTLTSEEAEEQFEKRNTTLDYFSVMVRKRLQVKEEEDDAKENSGKNKKSTLARMMDGDLQIQNEDDWSLSDSDDDQSGGEDGRKGDKKKKGKSKAKKKRVDDDEDLEVSDEDADVEQSKEVDYMSDSSDDDDDKKTGGYADDEEPRLAKKKEQADNNDDSDEFTESSEEEGEDHLTKSGRETKELLARQSESEDEEVDEADEDEDFDSLASKKINQESSNDSSGKEEKAKSLAQTTISKKVEEEKAKWKVKAMSKGKSKAENNEQAPPPAKKAKLPLTGRPTGTPPPPSAAQRSIGSHGNGSRGTNSDDGITEEAVRRYLSRKPITTKDLFKKFRCKTNMDGDQLVPLLGELIRRINPHKETIRGKTYLSLRS